MRQHERTRDSLFHLFDQLTDYIIIIDVLGKIMYLNPKAENLFNVTSISCIGNSLHTLIPNLKIELECERDQKVFIRLRESIPLSIQSQSLSIENEEYKVLLLKDLDEEKGRMGQWSTISKELADIKLALDESTIVAITDPKGMITFVNHKFCALSQYKEEELIGKNHSILNSGYHSKEFFRDMWRTIGKGEVWKGEIQNKAKDGSFYWVDTTIVPFMDENGKPYQYVSIRTDITKRVHMDREIQEALKMDFTHTIKNLQNGIFKIRRNEEGSFIYTVAEGKLLDEIGLTSDILSNKTPYDVFSPEIAHIKQEHYEKAFQGHRVNYEVELRGRPVSIEVAPLKRGDRVIELVASVQDMSELRFTQKELQVNQQHYQSLFEHSQDYVIVYHTDGRIIDMNPKMIELLRLSKETIQNLTVADMISEKYEEMRYGYFERAVQGHPQNFEMNIINKHGEKMCFNVTLLPIILEGQIKGVYSIRRDITEHKKIQEMNAYLAHHDELTKLPNRRWMEQKLYETLCQAEQNHQKLAVLFIDLDRFKSINDTLGHLIGDRLLELLSARLLESIDQEKQFAARISGDEFMILCPGMAQDEEAIQTANKLLHNLRAPFYIENHELFVSASVGISIYPTGGTSAMDLMKKADIALYRAKELGRNIYQLYNDSMDERNYQSFLLERDLRKAIMNNEFIAHFQPRVDALTGEIIGAEALIRWLHPKAGLISPGEFIPLAEETGLIIPLGKWMKRRVCEQLAAWREAGIPLIPISVNISSQRFLQSDFSKEVRELLFEYQLEGKWLEFEITENSLMKHEEYILQTLYELKDKGVKIYIDDFGTGYSSFHYLKAFKLDGIKIDRSFIQNISHQSENAGITATMIKMAQYLRMNVIAEGVETEEELSFLLEQDCHQIQGFYFGKPCSMEEFQQKYMLTGQTIPTSEMGHIK